MRIHFLLLVGLVAAGCQSDAPKMDSATANRALHQLFTKSGEPLDGEYAERYAAELLAVARRMGPESFAQALRAEVPSTRKAVARFLVPQLQSRPEDRRLLSELERL